MVPFFPFHVMPGLEFWCLKRKFFVKGLSMLYPKRLLGSGRKPNGQIRGAEPDKICDFPNLPIKQAHPLYTVIGQVC